MKTMDWKVLIEALAVVAAGQNWVHADVITFNNFGATPNGTQWTTYTELGYQVAATQNRWNVAQLFGNPTPDVFSNDSSPSQISVTYPVTGFFNFNSVDLAQSGGGVSSYDLRGLLSGSVVLSQSGVQTGGAFSTVASVNPSQILDTLLITYTYGSGTVFGWNIDNINLTAAVPEASTWAAGGVVVLMVGVAWRRRKV